MIDYRIQEIVSKMLEISFENDSSDDVRNLYSTLMDVRAEVGKLMRYIRENESTGKEVT